jgi:uncharacterized protein YbjQ (UPF0145 family)
LPNNGVHGKKVSYLSKGHPGGMRMQLHMITTGLALKGYRTVKTLGVVRGLTVRSRGALGNLAAGVQQFFGGDITVYTRLCEQARQDAFDRMKEHAEQLGANAIVGMRYDATEIAPGVTEVLAYGTALVVEHIKP